MNAYALDVQGLTKSYEKFTLGPITFSLPSGCILGLVGENGAGKTTTIKLLLNMLRKEKGNVSLLGMPLEGRNAVKIKEDIGVVLDEANFPDCITSRQIHAVLKRIYQNWDEEAYFQYIQKFSLPLDKPFKDFSRGMKMKLSLAAALSHHPKLLILDEATSGLDPVARDEILDIFNDFTQDEGHSILLSSHIVSDLEKICDYIAFLHKGKMLLCEEKDMLLESCGTIHCTQAEFQRIHPKAVIGKRVTPYGIEAVARRSELPSGMAVSPAGLEDIFVCMVKEER